MEALLFLLKTDIVYELLAVTIVYLIYRRVEHGPFLFDDLAVWAAEPHQYLKQGYPSPFQRFGQWFRSHSLKEFVKMRPLTWLTYNMDASLYGISPVGWHRTSITIHLVSVWVFYHILRHWFDPLPAFLGTLIFGLHPLSTMAVSYISGRSSLLCGMYVLCVVATVLDHRYVSAVLFTVLAALSKEEAIVLLPVIVGALWLKP
jgi:hypothetical protein